MSGIRIATSDAADESVEETMKFGVQASNDGRATYVSDEFGRVRIELKTPIDFQHAWRVAEFLSENVQRIIPENLDH